MDKKEQYDEDLLRKYINPEKIIKAPEGFTSKTLTRIQIESQSKEGTKSFFVRNRIPLISLIITAGLIVAAIFIPENKTDVVGTAILKFFQDIPISIPEIKLTGFKDMSLPGWIGYSYLVILLLVFIDWALSGAFRKQRK
jgi:hypothetical protein